MNDLDFAWFIVTLPGLPFVDVPEPIVSYALLEAQVSSDLKCMKEYCPDAFPFAVALQTALILYAEGYPQAATAGGTPPPAPAPGDSGIKAVVKKDTTGPVSREYEIIKPTDLGELANESPTLAKRLKRLIDQCKPPVMVGLVGLAGLSPTYSNCEGCPSGRADKADDWGFFDDYPPRAGR